MIYRTFFNLTDSVIDFESARQYLIEDDMTKYIHSDSHIPVTLKQKIKNIIWILKDEKSGHIDLETKEELLESELEIISDWVTGQNADGIGEGFSNQPFANYECEGDSFDDWEEECEYAHVMASFDWQTNDYKFELVSK